MENKELLKIMEKCGHFLYHRRGGKRGQLKILRIINEKESITQKELQEELMLKSSSISETVKKLENKGFIIKKRDSSDKRRTNIMLSDKGRSFLESQAVIMREQERVLFTALNEGEQEELKTLLSKLFEDWQSKFDSSLFGHKKQREEKSCD